MLTCYITDYSLQPSTHYSKYCQRRSPEHPIYARSESILQQQGRSRSPWFSHWSHMRSWSVRNQPFLFHNRKNKWE
ncbi:hypothetical protein K493DRAFT_67904 [Basidiobolus meristosporus CBS 931.73]|uniref:Uncharacterized protein n=1 Tax=Basidiobolus meristosporus CBS 931.73 TaxID=1314790 RepID=A0A1Y1Z016_9FUNG|nr:hypothetical protein K493DRAFT_67904 [Basidiobolus meristosporus CBS 931.73]|eukprot:ORY03640.1 hypothetical protein K493DRAFT_67904 [Basidiobolus meristosporus CBS 931.73]